MTIRGGGDPTNSMGLRAALQNGPAARSLAADAHDCIMVLTRPGSTEYKLAARWSVPSGELPSDRDPSDSDRTTWGQDTGSGESRPDGCLTPRAPYKLFALAYNLGNFLRTLALPDEVAQWSLTTLREKLVKIGARIVRHGRYVVFQLAEVAVPRALFAEILRRIDRLRGSPMVAA